MNSKKVKRINKMVRKVQKSLKMASYRVKSELQDDQESEYAEIFYTPHKKKATIIFNKKNINNELRNTVIHELLHLFINKHLGVAENVFERQRKFKSLKKYQKGEERAVEILAPFLEKAILGSEL